MRIISQTVVLIVILGLLCLSSLGWAQSFPTLEGKTLANVDLSLPQGFHSTYNLILIPLEQNQQTDAETWMPYSKALTESQASFNFYQLLPMGKMNGLLRSIIRGAMRDAYDDVVKAQTIPLFVEQEPVLTSLNIADTSAMQVLLVQDQSIIWRTTGAWSEAKAAELEQYLRN